MKLELKFLPWTLLSLYSIKILVLGAEFVDAPILLILATFLGFIEYKASDKKYQELILKYNELEEKHQETEKKIEEIKVHISSMKLTAQAKAGNIFGR